jgi:protein phosphatase
MIVVTWGSATDTGRVRARNEDAVLAQAPVFLVADGMGGHLGGEVASQMTVEAFRELLGRTTVTPADIPELIQDANQAIRARARVDPTVSDMGTTAVGLAMVKEGDVDYWLAFNVGDSRIYRMHQGVLTQVTVDHSYVQDLVAAGRIAPEEARTHPERNIVTRVLGVQESPVPDFWVFPPSLGERFLICSDGLSGELDDHIIAQLLALDAEPHEVARMLVEAANLAGGRDNISVIVVDVAGADAAEQTAVLGPATSAAETTRDLPIVPDDVVTPRPGPVAPPATPVTPIAPPVTPIDSYDTPPPGTPETPAQAQARRGRRAARPPRHRDPGPPDGSTPPPGAVP